MKKREKKHRKISNENSPLEKALTILIGSTRRAKRRKDLAAVAKALRVAEGILGSRGAVAKILDLSPEMLRNFASVEKLHPDIKQMVKKGLLTSVDVAYRISMLPQSEQLPLAKAYANNELKGKDIRDVVQFRKRHPHKTIMQAIEGIKETRDIIQYVIKFRGREKDFDGMNIKEKFGKLCGKENIISVEIKGSIVTLTISDEGQRKLQEKARERGLTRRRLIEDIL